MEFQLVVEVLLQEFLGTSARCRWIQPFLVGGGIKNDGLSVMELRHRFPSWHRDDRAARDAKLVVPRPDPSKREGRVARKVDVPWILLAITLVECPFVEG